MQKIFTFFGTVIMPLYRKGKILTRRMKYSSSREFSFARGIEPHSSALCLYTHTHINVTKILRTISNRKNARPTATNHKCQMVRLFRRAPSRSPIFHHFKAQFASARRRSCSRRIEREFASFLPLSFPFPSFSILCAHPSPFHPRRSVDSDNPRHRSLSFRVHRSRLCAFQRPPAIPISLRCDQWRNNGKVQRGDLEDKSSPRSEKSRSLIEERESLKARKRVIREFKYYRRT